MKFKVFRLFIILFSVSFGLIGASDNFSNFNTKVKTTYTLKKNGVLLVDHDFNLKNVNYLYFLKKYQLMLPTNQILNVSVDSEQEINLNVKKEEAKTIFSLDFQSPLVGESKENKFKLLYQNSSSVKKYGLKYDLFLNNLAHDNDFDNYEIVLKIPKEIGAPSIISAEYDETIDDEFYNYSFKNFSDLKNLYVSIGDEQRFDFNFSTTLNNDSSYKNTFSLAIPSNDQFQKVVYDNIDPKPDLFKVDDDGNWIISYIVKPLSKVEVSLTGQVILHKNTEKTTLKAIEKESLIKPQLFWESDNEKIVELANFLKSPEEVYLYLKDNLSYSQSLNERLGAVNALEEKQNANCQSFSDLGVAILRAKGIPARRVVGFALTNFSSSKNLFDGSLHSWIEYFYNGEWLMMDPTFGKNIDYYDYFNYFDLNHFSLVKNGFDSYQPTAIGEDFFINKSNNLIVTFSKEISNSNLSLDDISLDFQKRDFFNFNLPSYTFLISNKTGKFIDNLNLNLEYDENLFSLDLDNQMQFSLLPFENKKIVFKVYKNEGMNKTTLDLAYTLGRDEGVIAQNKVSLITTSWLFKFIKPRWVLVIAFFIFLILAFLFNFLIFKKRKRSKFN